MSLSASVLKTALLASLQAKHTAIYPFSAPGMLDFHTIVAEAVAETVIAHLTSSAVVMPTALAAPPGIVGGPVTGTGTIT